MNELPYEEIRAPDGNYFDYWGDVLAAGYPENQVWCITIGDDEDGTWFCYDSEPHFVNVIGFIATKERAYHGECYEELLINEGDR